MAKTRPKNWWPKRRLQQLDKLRTLLIEAQTIDRGSGATRRIKKVIRLAEQLDGSFRTSFLSWLYTQAVPEEPDPGKP